jgi:hypothetical protein
MQTLKLELIEDEIGRKLAEAEQSGELRSAEGYGRPMQEDAGWEQTPVEFRMPFKILRNAGVAPPEIGLFHERARLREAVEAASTAEERAALQRALGELEQKIALRLEGLRLRGSL